MQLEWVGSTADHLKIRAVTELRSAPSDLYLEGMEHRGLWVRGFCVCLLALALVGSVNAKAEEAPDDAAGRAYFERGRQAFESADYESALTYFRHAYRLSRRGELQYNIGVTADRLQREEEALEAFQRYLKESEDPTRAAEARERIEVLETSIAERKATELALREATIRYQSAQTGPSVPITLVP